jgi:flagellar biogenesis protein FliO
MTSASGAARVRGNHLARIVDWLMALGRSWRSHPSRQLYLRETLALGERRFIAVVEFEQQKFLIAGTGSSVAMLTALPEAAGAKENPKPEAGHEEVPTWEFASAGPARQLVRR